MILQHNVIETKNSPQQDAPHLQHLLASIIPVAAILLLGAYGSQRVQPDSTLLFTILFLCAAIATFMGERKVITLIQSRQDRRCIELTTACREFLAGNWGTKVAVRDKNELSKLAEMINLLLDQQRHLLQIVNSNPPSRAAPPTPEPHNKEAEFLNQQLMQIINELSPIANGDLRVKTSVSTGLIGIIADACNSFIEELAKFVKWTRYASHLVRTTSQSILQRSIDMAKNTESQVHRLAQTTHNVEEIASFMQHLSNTLYLSFDISKEIQNSIQEKLATTEQIIDTPLAQLLNEMQRQTELLEGVLASAEETSKLAVSLIDDLNTVTRQTYQSSSGLLKIVERLSELEALAQHWHQVSSAFTIEKDTSETQEPWLL